VIPLPKAVADALRFDNSATCNMIKRFPASEKPQQLHKAANWSTVNLKQLLVGYSDGWLQTILRLTTEVSGVTIPEYVYRDFVYHTTPEATREVAISTGIVDVMTPYEVIEVKAASQWKHALGQVLAYSHTTNLQPTVALFGDIPDEAIKLFAKYDIKLLTLG